MGHTFGLAQMVMQWFYDKLDLILLNDTRIGQEYPGWPWLATENTSVDCCVRGECKHSNTAGWSWCGCQCLWWWSWYLPAYSCAEIQTQPLWKWCRNTSACMYDISDLRHVGRDNYTMPYTTGGHMRWIFKWKRRINIVITQSHVRDYDAMNSKK